MVKSKTLKEYKLKWALSKDIPCDSDDKDLIIYEFIKENANDSNSSKFREDVTKWVIGLETSEGKHGYDDDFNAIEVKPKNFTGKSKLNGGGSFSDFTWKRDEKYAKDKVKMLISGFYYGKLLFIVEFDYNVIRPKIQSLLKKRLPNGDVKNNYVRSAGFSYIDWIDSSYIKHYISPNLDEYKTSIVKKLYEKLKDD